MLSEPLASIDELHKFYNTHQQHHDLGATGKSWALLQAMQTLLTELDSASASFGRVYRSAQTTSNRHCLCIPATDVSGLLLALLQAVQYPLLEQTCTQTWQKLGFTASCFDSRLHSSCLSCSNLKVEIKEYAACMIRQQECDVDDTLKALRRNVLVVIKRMSREGREDENSRWGYAQKTEDEFLHLQQSIMELDRQNARQASAETKEKEEIRRRVLIRYASCSLRSVAHSHKLVEWFLTGCSTS